jgi:hypothetical protein
MGAFGVEPRIEMAADSTAHIVFDNMMDMNPSTFSCLMYALGDDI